VLTRGLDYILAQQHIRDGSWPTREGADDGYTRYHATMCATMALYSPEFRGYGPGSPELAKLIAKWNKRDKLSGLADETSEEQIVPSLSFVEPAYTGALRVNSIRSNNLEDLGEARLGALLRWKLVVAEQNVSGYTKSSGDRDAKFNLMKLAAGRSSFAARQRAVELSKTKKPYRLASELVDTDDDGSIDDLL
jgi:hypothetical protein